MIEPFSTADLSREDLDRDGVTGRLQPCVSFEFSGGGVEHGLAEAIRLVVEILTGRPPSRGGFGFVAGITLAGSCEVISDSAIFKPGWSGLLQRSWTRGSGSRQCTQQSKISQVKPNSKCIPERLIVLVWWEKSADIDLRDSINLAHCEGLK